MTGKKVLVVFHSSSGNTKRVAAAIAEALSADIEQIQPTRPFRVDIKGKGLRNFMNMGRAALGGLSSRAASIREAQHNPAEYDLVLVGTPVYAGSLSGPARAYLERYQTDLREVAFFCTGEDPNNQDVFAQMEEVCGKAPRAVHAFHAPQVKSGEFLPQVQEFIAGL